MRSEKPSRLRKQQNSTMNAKCNTMECKRYRIIESFTVVFAGCYRYLSYVKQWTINIWGFRFIIRTIYDMWMQYVIIWTETGTKRMQNIWWKCKWTVCILGVILIKTIVISVFLLWGQWMTKNMVNDLRTVPIERSYNDQWWQRKQNSEIIRIRSEKKNIIRSFPNSDAPIVNAVILSSMVGPNGLGFEYVLVRRSWPPRTIQFTSNTHFSIVTWAITMI